MAIATHATAVLRSPSVLHKESGAVAVMFIGSLLAIVGVYSLALDMSMLYNRRIEMQNVADTVALAAAAELNGRATGVSLALQRASERFVTLPGTVVGGLSYKYSTQTMEWSPAAIEFGTTPDGPWVSASAAAANPNGLLFARVDTRGLDPSYGELDTLFLRVISPEKWKISASARATAGRTAIKVTPLGICAMRSAAARDHKGELEEFGFRRGAAYDLMQLNPNSTTPGNTFLINPTIPPGTVGAAPPLDAATVAPYVCTGTMAMARITGGAVTVTSPFPLSQLFTSFNSRFDSYTTPCNADSAPPDSNIKEYKYDDGSVPWMTARPSSQAAAQSLADGKLWTVLGPDDTPAGTTAAQYGPLWSYAKAAKFSAYSNGVPEPTAGYTTFGTGDWATLYSTGNPQATGYPSTTPYSQSTGQHFKAPVHKSIRDRRVLNVPLLACPVAGNRAQVLGIGKFFMTVQADAAMLVGEFAGLAVEQSLGSNVNLYP